MGLDGESFRWLKRGGLLAMLLLAVTLVIAIPRLGEAQGGNPNDPALDLPAPDLGSEASLEGAESASATKIYFVPAHEFVDKGTSANFYAYPYIYPNPSAESFDAPIHLPDGVTITKFSTWAYDNDASGSVSSYLYRLPYKTETWPESIAFQSTSSGGTSPNIQNPSVNVTSNNVVDNSNYIYFFEIIVSGTNSNVGLYGAQVEYTE